jgi:hypothetical protein
MSAPFRPNHPIADCIDSLFDELSAVAESDRVRESAAVELVALDTLAHAARDRQRQALHDLVVRRERERRENAGVERRRDLGERWSA